MNNILRGFIMFLFLGLACPLPSFAMPVEELSYEGKIPEEGLFHTARFKSLGLNVDSGTKNIHHEKMRVQQRRKSKAPMRTTAGGYAFATLLDQDHFDLDVLVMGFLSPSAPAVPEPMSLILVASGLLGVLTRRRR
ncbi:PEP-CTERM sorting domain-containing protein [PVC group bacterium]|nr:PEP-CTERM sorting domain-containing protein [PVC group bacterium]